MICLITGGAGFIGSHLAELLLERGHAVRILDRPGYDLKKIRFLMGRVEFMGGDITDEDFIARAVADVDVVFHLVSVTVPAVAQRDPTYGVRGNIVSSINLFERCVQAGVKKVVFVSSGGTVYGAPIQIPIPETHPTWPVSCFGVSRLSIEKYLHVYHCNHGLDYAIMRVGNAYGERQKTRSGQGVISVWMEKIFRGEDVELYGDGRIVRDYVYVKDVVSALVLAAEKQTERKIFNVGSGQGTSLRQILDLTREVVGADFPVRQIESRQFDVEVSILDISRARSELGWEPAVSLKDGMARTWAWISGKRA